jgi:hypothetical protein
LLNAPQDILCSELCSCPPSSEFDIEKWPDNFFRRRRPNGERFFMNGDYISLETCILDGLNNPDGFKAAKMQAALMKIPLDTLATLDEGQTERAILLMNEIYDEG